MSKKYYVIFITKMVHIGSYEKSWQQIMHPWDTSAYFASIIHADYQIFEGSWKDAAISMHFLILDV